MSQKRRKVVFVVSHDWGLGVREGTDPRTVPVIPMEKYLERHVPISIGGFDIRQSLMIVEEK